MQVTGHVSNAARLTFARRGIDTKATSVTAPLTILEVDVPNVQATSAHPITLASPASSSSKMPSRRVSRRTGTTAILLSSDATATAIPDGWARR